MVVTAVAVLCEDRLFKNAAGFVQAVVGAANRHEWLDDEALAAQLDNPVVASGSHRPMFVLRPRLSRGALVVVEGEVV